MSIWVARPVSRKITKIAGYAVTWIHSNQFCEDDRLRLWYIWISAWFTHHSKMRHVWTISELAHHGFSILQTPEISQEEHPILFSSKMISPAHLDWSDGNGKIFLDCLSFKSVLRARTITIVNIRTFRANHSAFKNADSKFLQDHIAHYQHILDSNRYPKQSLPPPFIFHMISRVAITINHRTSWIFIASCPFKSVLRGRTIIIVNHKSHKSTLWGMEVTFIVEGHDVIKQVPVMTCTSSNTSWFKLNPLTFPLSSLHCEILWTSECQLSRGHGTQHRKR
jgi:hypothetical protein